MLWWVALCGLALSFHVGIIVNEMAQNESFARRNLYYLYRGMLCIAMIYCADVATATTTKGMLTVVGFGGLLVYLGFMLAKTAGRNQGNSLSFRVFHAFLVIPAMAIAYVTDCTPPFLLLVSMTVGYLLNLSLDRHHHICACYSIFLLLFAVVFQSGLLLTVRSTDDFAP